MLLQTFRSTLILLALVAGGQAYACRFQPDLRPESVRINEAPFAFIGTVTSTQNNMVIFRIEKHIKGLTQMTYSIEQDELHTTKL